MSVKLTPETLRDLNRSSWTTAKLSAHATAWATDRAELARLRGVVEKQRMDLKLSEHVLLWIDAVLTDNDYRQSRGGGYTRAELFDYMLSVIRAGNEDEAALDQPAEAGEEQS